MSESVKLFNALNGVKATRKQLEKIADVCVREEQTHIFTKIQNVLFYNEDDIFDIELRENACEIAPASMLSCLHCEEIEEDFTGLNKAVSPTDIYQMITDRMLKMIKEASGNNYKKKWKGKIYGKGYTIPFNYESKKRYRGVNVFLLTSFEPLENPYFLTFKQIESNKGKLKKGSIGNPVVYFTKLYKVVDSKRNIDFGTYKLEKAKEFAKENKIEESAITYLPILKYYNVFNGKDIEGIDFDLDNFKIGYIEQELPAVEKMPIPEAIIKNYPKPAPKLNHGGDKAFYSPFEDKVQIPYLADFETAQDYYRTLMHEFSHSTGRSNRLDRDFTGKFGSKKYAFEELVAEWGATFLSAEAGIIWHTNNNHAEYLKNWNNVLTYLSDDTKFIMKACTKAQELTDFILQFDDNGTPKYLKDLKNIAPKIEIEKPKKANGQEKTKTDPKKDTKKAIKPLKSKVYNVQKKPKKEKISNQYALFGVNVTTDIFKKMSVTELRKFTLDYYKEHLSGKKVLIEEQLKEVVFTNAAGRKIAHGEAMYSEKAAAIEHLEQLIKNSTYNNFGEAKSSDNKEILGYLNFKSKLTIDGIKRHLRIALAVYKNRKTELKNIEVGKKISDSPKKTRTSRNSQSDMSKPLVEDKFTKKNNTNKNEGISKPLAGVPAIQEVEKPVATNKLMQLQFDSLPINEEWQELMQNPAANLKIAIWGKPKNGKTSASLQMAEYFTNFGNVLYNFADQGFNKSTQDLWISSGLANNPKAFPDDSDTIDALESKIATGKYKFVFIDMISDYIRLEKIKPEDFKTRFIKKYPDVSFILIFEVTKSGDFKGDQGWTHLVDAIMTVEDFLIENRGRYGMGQRVVWEEGFKRFNPKKYQEYIESQTTSTAEEEMELSPGPIDFPEFSFNVN